MKRDVGVLLGAMIVKNVDETRQEGLMDDIGMEQIDNKIKKLAKDEYGSEIRKAERKNLELEQELVKTKKDKQKLQERCEKVNKELKKITAMPNLNPEIKKMINSIIVLR